MMGFKRLLVLVLVFELESFCVSGAVTTSKNEFQEDEELLQSLYHSSRRTPLDYGGKHPWEARKIRETLWNASLEAYAPIRIKFVTDPLEEKRNETSLRDDMIDALIDSALPKAASVWSLALYVIPVANATIQFQSSNPCNDTVGAYNISDTYITEGVADADLVVVVTAFGCGDQISAHARTCDMDQWDRPIVGRINWCMENIFSKMQHWLIPYPGTMKVNSMREEVTDSIVEYMTQIMIHELGHILGQSDGLFFFFRDPETGKPRTSRPFNNSQDTLCNNGYPSPYALSESTFQRVSMDEVTGHGYHEIVLPHVVQVVRNMFNCQTMTGAPVENQRRCIGSHWDERLFYSESMGPKVLPEANALSALTLALMEDSGWYKVSYESAVISTFGHGLGCDFVQKDCIVNGSVPKFGRDLFCDTFLDENDVTSSVQCNPTHQIWAQCDLDRGFMPIPYPIELDTYFPNTKFVKLVEDRAAYCPIPWLRTGVNCAHEEIASVVQYYPGESYGTGSRCINAKYQNEMGQYVSRPACMKLSCIEEKRVVVIGSGSTTEFTCDFDFQQHDIPGTNATLTCPRLATVCPELFCPANCAGRGICNFGALPSPKCECFDLADMSPGCFGGTVQRTDTVSPSTFEPSTGAIFWMCHGVSALLVLVLLFV